jgi:hypothetical protein
MFNPRLLLIAYNLPDATAALTTVLGALTNALFPRALRFALPARFAGELEHASLPVGARLQFFEESAGVGGVLPLIGDATHFLLLRGEYAFGSHWDVKIFARYCRCPSPRKLATAAITADCGEAQAHLPAVRGAVDDSGAPLGAGLALVNSARPVKTLLVHPALALGKICALSAAQWDIQTLSITAYAAGYAVYALDRTPLWPTARASLTARLKVPPPWTAAAAQVNRFEQLAGFSFIQGAASVRATLGIFTVEDAYAQRLPANVWIRQRFRALTRPVSNRMPLVVSAFIDLSGAAHPMESYLLRFSYLKALNRLPLTLYTGGEAERRLHANFPNTLAYPDSSLLHRTLLAEGMTQTQLFKRNKLLLLERAGRAFPTYSHIAWLDIDALPHPICPEAEPDFSTLMDDRVHIAWVDGHPDTSLMVVPRALLRTLANEVQTATQLDVVMKRSLSERQLIRHLIKRRPDWFALHMLPRKGLLFLSCYPKSLLSAPVGQLTYELPAPLRLAPRAQTRKESEPHA